VLDPGVRELRAAAGEPGTWAVVAGLVALGVLLERADPGAPSWGRLVVYGVVPAVVLALTLAVLAKARRWLALSALALAVSPTVLTATAASLRPGAVAIVVASLAALGGAFGWFSDTRMRIAAAAGAVVLFVAAWAAAVRQFGPDRPGLSRAVGATGSFLQGVTGVVGRAPVTLAWSGQLLWWTGAGLIVGAALLAGRVRTAALVPAAVGAICVFGWAVQMWRGPLDGRHVAWVLAAALAYAGAAIPLAAVEERRLATGAGALASASWLIGIVRVFRLDGRGLAELAVEVIIASALVGGVTVGVAKSWPGREASA
jgi:hypothetical protein